jgi:two-component system response regulator
MNLIFYDLILIEDNPDDAKLAVRELQKNNLVSNCLHLKDGEEAIRFFKTNIMDVSESEKQLPKLILLDLKMPKIDGLEVLKELKTHEKTRKIPIVIFSSSNEAKDIKNAYENGADSYIMKPVEFNEFKNVIKEIGLKWLHNG